MSTVDIDKVEVITRNDGNTVEISVDGSKTYWCQKDFTQLSALLATHTQTLKAELLAKIVERVKDRLPNPYNDVAEWSAHNLGFHQAIAVLEEEANRLKEEL